ncbi:T9SS type A sorting domain-containing protein [Aurantibacillus circumpalustris]|uniref:T9SS type A sorting domain-containing protein n=1 Tax=Aurantibacillus circumpalustris TaxID=3036359 RepID=UPI00295B203C|nr:T9SS type A sorting domain-containing protein [Aurantibacillus circumpalustris]
MKKQLLFTSFFFLILSATAQNGKKQRPSGSFDTKLLLQPMYSNEGLAAIQNADAIKPTSLPIQDNAKTNSTNWQRISSSMNIYGTIVSYCKPLQWNDELDVVSFIHRKSPTYSFLPTPDPTAATGGIVAFISNDCGANWDSTALYTNDNFWARYPNGAIYNPIGNTDINNAYIVGAGPATGPGNVTWIGNWYASKRLGTANYNNSPSIATNAQQVMPTVPPFVTGVPSRHDFAAYNFSATDDGKMRILARISNDANTSDTAVMLMTATFNNTLMAFDWAGKIFAPPTTSSTVDNTPNWVPQPMMAWNEYGDVGYIVIIGSRFGATGSNVGYQPIVYKTTNSGGTWSLENGINFNAASAMVVKNKLWAVASDSTLVVPNFLWFEGIDCTVDSRNRLHIFSSLAGQASNHTDSMNFVSRWSTENYLWPHKPGAMPYLADFIYDGANTNSWSKMLIDSMSTEGPGARTSDPGYQDNPWDADPSSSNNKVRVDARLQMSRTPDGKYLLFTWADSDTAYTDLQKKWNNLPNVKARLYDVENHDLSGSRIDLTENAQGDVANHAMYHFISPKFKLVSKTNAVVNVKLPITVSNSSPYSQKTVNQHWYSCAGINFSRKLVTYSNPWDEMKPDGLAENSNSNLLKSYLYPNPASNKFFLRLGSPTNTGIEITVVNLVGELVRSSQAEVKSGNNIISFDIQNLPSGIYLVSLKMGASLATKKLIVE